MAITIADLEAILSLNDKISPGVQAIIEKLDQLKETFDQVKEGGDSVFEQIASGAELAAGFIGFETMAEGIKEVVTGLPEMVSGFSEMSEHLTNLSERTGMTAEGLQEIGFAAGAVGLSTDQVAMAFSRFQKAAEAGTTRVVEVVNSLGLSLDQLKTMSPEQQFSVLLQRIGELPPGMERSTAAMTLFGRTGVALLPLISSFGELTAASQQLGVVMSADAIASGKDLQESFNILGMVLDGVKNNFVSVIVQSEPMQVFFQQLIVIVGQFSVWVKQNATDLRSWVDTGVAAAAGALAGLVTAVGSMIGMFNSTRQALVGFEGGLTQVALAAMYAFQILAHPTNVKAIWDEYKTAAITAAKATQQEMTQIEDSNTKAQAVVAKVQTAFDHMADSVANASGKIHTAVADTDAHTRSLDMNAAAAAKAAAAAQKLDQQMEKQHMAQAAQQAKELNSAQEALDLTEAKWMGTIDGTIQANQKQRDAVVNAAMATLIKDQATEKDTDASVDNYNKTVQLANQNLVLKNTMDENAAAAKNMAAAQQALGGVQTQINQAQNDLNTALASTMSTYDQTVIKIQNTTGAKIAEAQATLGQAQAIQLWLALQGIVDPDLDAYIQKEQQLLGVLQQTQTAQMNDAGTQKTIANFKDVGQVLTGLNTVLSTFGVSSNSGIGQAIKGFSELANAGASAAQAIASNGMDIGADISAVTGLVSGLKDAISGLFGGEPQWQKDAQSLGTELGTTISQSMSQQIEKDAATSGNSVLVQGYLDLDKVIAASGQTASDFGHQTQEMLVGISSGTIPAQAGLDEVDKVFKSMEDDATKAGTATNSAMIGVIQQARALGEVTPEMTSFINAGVKTALDGLNELIGTYDKASGVVTGGLGVGTGSSPAVTQEATNQATTFMAVFNAEISTQGLVATVTALDPAFQALEAKMKASGNQAGVTAVESITAPFAQLDKLMGNDAFAGAANAADGLSKIMDGLSQSVFLDQKTFDALQGSAMTSFNTMTAQGATSKQAIEVLAPEIQKAITASEQFGIPLDANTQRLVGIAQANGIAFKTDPMQQMVNVLTDIDHLMGGKFGPDVQNVGTQIQNTFKQGTADVQQAGANMTSSWQQATQTVNTQTKTISPVVHSTFSDVHDTAHDQAMYVANVWGGQIDSIKVKVANAAPGIQDSFMQIGTAATTPGSGLDLVQAKVGSINGGLISMIANAGGVAAAFAHISIPGGGPTGGPNIPKYQYGGFVPQTGLALLHAGEYVIPPGSNGPAGPGGGGSGPSGAVNLTIHVTGTNLNDPDMVARTVVTAIDQSGVLRSKIQGIPSRQ